ncbi:S8 family peptidase [Flavihumibacter fluvii]|uniref:S8 family peptidase n=1 Tax=Flavihumibacter fluvii TaxID=2838157 RepID=UPI001BDDF133|nr:S8/S53 family peptidase [Flavihumibacter fluvii]ULQ51781.1 S8/S53 family peptidase [Flavihumibacter fluvii]
MKNPPTKLMLRLKSVSRDIDEKDLVQVDNNDPINFASANSNHNNPWDNAYIALQENPDVSFAEPDIESGDLCYSYQQEIEERGEPDKASYQEFIDYWPHPKEASIWHLGDDFSQLKKAREEVAALPNKKTVRIAHFDTGYYKDHISFPAANIRKDLERDFVEGEEYRDHDAADSFDEGTLKMPGHGTGTLSILAGGKVSMPFCKFDDYIGLHDSIEIIPIRIAKSVVLLKSSAFVKALDYVANELNKSDATRVHVITMSMGGLASGAWADMVNMAYEKGIFIVTAAGNNFKKLPTRTLIFPARFNRVVAACGVTYDLSPYAKLHGDASFSIMEGNYGPRSLMNTAIAAFTPNVPWASYRFTDVVGLKGDGTSSATPQVASAAALYYCKYYDELEALPEPWMRVEAIRNALFSSAAKTINHDDRDVEKYFGNGILKAWDMLQVKVPPATTLVKQKEDKVAFPFFKVIFGIRAMEENDQSEEDMLETELMQLVLSDPALQELLQSEEKKLEDLNREQQKRLAEKILQNNKASEKLKESMQLLLNQLDIL